MRKRIRFKPGEAADLWQLEKDDDPLAAIRADFSTADCDIDEDGALQHAKAALVLAASGREVNEANYLACPHAVDSETARRDETELDGHLLNARLLADAAELELYARGHKKSDLVYPDLLIAEIESLARSSGVPYGKETQ